MSKKRFGMVDGFAFDECGQGTGVSVMESASTTFLPDPPEEILRGSGTDPEVLSEFGGRLCYRSVDRMGKADSFVVARIREGHEDVIEHAHISVIYAGFPAPINRYMHQEWLPTLQKWILTGNLRAWRQWFEENNRESSTWGKFLQAVGPHAPRVFADIGYIAPEPGQTPSVVNTMDRPTVKPYQIEEATVTLLACHLPGHGGGGHKAATFLLEGVSRALTHQLVRHRLASFSQESQRYVDLRKAGWNAIVPPSIRGNEKASAELYRFWKEAETSYGRLRALGIKKEDARFLLPNAAETRIVVTMDFPAWRHFVWLRALDQAAQWEIRRVGLGVLEMLHQISPPDWENEMAVAKTL